MTNPWTFYIDTVDTAAFDKARSGQTIFPKADWPFMPLIFPWMLGGPILLVVGLDSSWAGITMIVAMIASFALYMGFGLFFNQRVKAHRRELGIEVRRPFSRS